MECGFSDDDDDFLLQAAENEEKNKFYPPEQPFFKCQSQILPAAEEKFDSGLLPKLEAFGTIIQENMELVKNLALQNLWILTEFSDQQPNHELFDKQHLLQDFHVLLAYLRATREEQTSFSTLKLVNLAIGELSKDSCHRDPEMFHLNLSAKWSLIFALDGLYESRDGLYDNSFWNDSHSDHIGLLINLTCLSASRLKSSSDAFSFPPFPCPCVKSLWISLTKALKSFFWPCFLSLFQSQPTHFTKARTSTSLMIKHKELDGNLFWWILDSLIEHLDLDNQDDHSCLQAIKSHLRNNKNTKRMALKVLKRFTSKYPLDVDICTTLWEIYFDKINNNFNATKHGTLENLATMPRTHEQWVNEVMCTDEPRNDFFSFMHLLKAHFQRSERMNKEVQRFISRMRHKLNLAALQDLGLYNIFSLFMGLFEATKEPSIVRCLLDLVVNGVKSLKSELKVTVTKGLAALIVLQLKIESDLIEDSHKVLVEHCLESSVKALYSEKSSHGSISSQIVKMYLNFIKDPDCLSYDIFLSLPKLVSPSLIQFLDKFASHGGNESVTSEASIMLESLTVIVTRLRGFYAKLENQGYTTLSEEDVKLKTQIDDNLLPIFKLDGQIFTLLRTNLSSSLSAPAKEVAGLVSAIILLDDYSSESSAKYLHYLLTDSKVQLKVSLELLLELILVDHFKCPRELYILGYFRVMMRLDVKSRQRETFTQLQKLIANFLQSELHVKDFDEYLNAVEKDISESNYVNTELARIKAENSKFIDILTDNSKLCRHESFFTNCGKVARIFAPLLHYNYQFGGSNLHKFIKPILAEFEKRNLSVVQKKQYSLLIPDILVAFSTAVSNYAKDASLKKAVKESMKNCMEKLAVEDLRPMLRLLFESKAANSALDQDSLQSDFFEVVSKNLLANPNLEQNGLKIILIVFDHVFNLDAIEKLIQSHLFSILWILIRDKPEANINTKRMAGAVLDRLVKLYDSDNHRSIQLPSTLSDFVRSHFADRYKAMHEFLRPILQSSRALASRMSDTLRASIEHLHEKRPTIGNHAQVLYQDLLM